MLWPLLFTSPFVGVSSPVNICINVDLPDPLFPTTAMVSPALIDKETSIKAWKAFSFLP
jgi:hypothetical protein